MSKQLTPVDDLKKSIEAMAPQFKAALPQHIPIERFVRAVQTAISNTPSLAQANRTSFYAACMKSAEMGLFANGRDAALVPYGDKVTFIPMIAGVLKLIRNSGELATIMAEIVYANDSFEYWVDTEGPHLKHRPEVFKPRGRSVGVYALAKMKDGAVFIEVMNDEQVTAVRKSSRSPDKGPWSQFPEEMAKKTILRRLAKRLPMSTDLDQVITRDDDMYEFNQPVVAGPQAVIGDGTGAEPIVAPKKSRLKQAIAETVPQAVDAEPVVMTPEEEIPL